MVSQLLRVKLDVPKLASVQTVVGVGVFGAISEPLATSADTYPFIGLCMGQDSRVKVFARLAVTTPAALLRCTFVAQAVGAAELNCLLALLAAMACVAGCAA